KSSNITIQGLRFDSKFAAVNGVANKIVSSGIEARGVNLTIRDNEFVNLGNAINTNTSPRGVMVQDNIAPLATGLRDYFVWGQGQDHVYVGNTVANSTREHIVRVSGIER